MLVFALQAVVTWDLEGVAPGGGMTALQVERRGDIWAAEGQVVLG